jgi:hypothetical protein
MVMTRRIAALRAVKAMGNSMGEVDVMDGIDVVLV